MPYNYGTFLHYFHVLDALFLLLFCFPPLVCNKQHCASFLWWYTRDASHFCFASWVVAEERRDASAIRDHTSVKFGERYLSSGIQISLRMAMTHPDLPSVNRNRLSFRRESFSNVVVSSFLEFFLLPTYREVFDCLTNLERDCILPVSKSTHGTLTQVAV